MTLGASIATPHVDWFALSPTLALLGAAGVSLMIAVLLPACGEEDRPFRTLADGQVDRAGGTRHERDDVSADPRSRTATATHGANRPYRRIGMPIEAIGICEPVGT